MEDIAAKELYRIINHALSKIRENSDTPINEEIVLLKKRYVEQSKNIELPPFLGEFGAAEDFCNALEAYRLSTDVYAENPPELFERNVRLIQKGIERYRPHIDKENYVVISALETTIRSRLPELRSQYVLEQYNKMAKLIYGLKKKQKAKKISPADCERLALQFFTDVLNDKELKGIGLCPEKMELYENTLNIVDCLPKARYNKTMKFQLKSQLYRAISLGALKLDYPDEGRAKTAYNEYLRFKNAADNALAHTKNPQIAEALRRKREQDEWKYK